VPVIVTLQSHTCFERGIAMVSSVSSTTNASSASFNNPTQDPTAGQTQSGQTDPSQTNPNHKSKPINTAAQVANLRAVEESLAKKLTQVAKTAGSDPAALDMVAALTSQITAIQTQISNISSLNSMRQQNHSVTALQNKSASQSLKTRNEAQQISGHAQKVQKSARDDAASRVGQTSTRTNKPFRFDLTGTYVDEIA
jgi:hypothetical protein